METKIFEAIKNDLESIKKLLALGLIKQGINTTSVGKALGVSQARVSQLLAQKSRKKES